MITLWPLAIDPIVLHLLILEATPQLETFFENRATDYAKGALSGNWENVWGAAA